MPAKRKNGNYHGLTIRVKIKLIDGRVQIVTAEPMTTIFDLVRAVWMKIHRERISFEDYMRVVYISIECIVPTSDMYVCMLAKWIRNRTLVMDETLANSKIDPAQLALMDAITLEPTRRILTLECGHAFDSTAITTWYASSQTCPICRAMISPRWRHPTFVRYANVRHYSYMLLCDECNTTFVSRPCPCCGGTSASTEVKVRESRLATIYPFIGIQPISDRDICNIIAFDSPFECCNGEACIMIHANSNKHGVRLYHGRARRADEPVATPSIKIDKGRSTIAIDWWDLTITKCRRITGFKLI